jgi:phosphate acetyltransferase
MPNSEVAGQKNKRAYFSDLNTGIIRIKQCKRNRCFSIGPMLQGLNKPVNDLSRGCTVDDIINT